MLSYLLKQVAFNVAINHMKKKAILIYLRSLQVARKSLLFAFILFSFFQVMILGFVGAIMSGIWLIPIDDPQIRLWIIFGVFAALFVIPAFSLMMFFSEKHWYQISGTSEYLKSEENKSANPNEA